MDVCIYGPALAPPVEYARWTLDRMEVPYRFERAAAGLSAFRSWRLGVPIELPLLIIDGAAHGGFRTAYEQLHARFAGSARRWEGKRDPELVDDLLCNAFGPAVRCFYRTMLQHPALMKPMATDEMPFAHRLFIRGFYPVWRWMMTRGLKLESTSLADDLASLNDVFERVATRLEGRPFLAGDAPGGEDILFAAVASPVILPRDHPQPLPSIEALPEPLHGQVDRFRQSLAGQLALRIYRYRKLPSG